MLSRRVVLKGLAGAVGGSFGFATYAFALEPVFGLVVTSYHLAPAGWPADFPLRIAVVSDIHAAEPHMPAHRVEAIVRQTNALRPDLIVVLGDFFATHAFVTRYLPPDEWAEPLSELKAPLGVFAILGNHDWWHGPMPGLEPDEGRSVRRALARAGLAVMENDAVRLTAGGRPFWLLGLGDQIAFPLGGNRFLGVDDLPGTLAKVTDDAPVVLLAHEPDIFPHVPPRVSLTLAGHTHGGQLRILGYSPVVPSAYGNRYAYGLIVEEGRSMIVSGGLGLSTIPMRLGVPPEIVLVRLGEHPVT